MAKKTYAQCCVLVGMLREMARPTRSDVNAAAALLTEAADTIEHLLAVIDRAEKIMAGTLARTMEIRR